MPKFLYCFAVGLCLCASGFADGPAQPASATDADKAPPLDREQARQLAKWLKQLKHAAEAADRKQAVDQINRLGPRGAAALKPLVDARVDALTEQYARTLAPVVRTEYLKRLGELTDSQILQVQKTRRLWKPYLLEPRPNKQFRQIYLRAIRKIGDFLILKPDQILNGSLKTCRETLIEWAEYRNDLHRVLKIDPDPTKARTSPTGIAYAPLDQPPTFRDRLHHFERTLILIHSVAPPGAAKGLWMNDRAAREIDVQEAEFVMSANEVRLLAGTVVWRADPLGCAVTRDHSNDRKNGKASGHMSTVPGKRGFGDRNRRMGAAFFNSEGAGGGRSGRGYLNGLSYSGTGHGGPLYSRKRNCVGVGRRGGVYTSQYRLDKSILHPAHVWDNESFLPPGIELKQIRNRSLQVAALALKAGAFAAAQRHLDKTEPRTDLDRILLRFFASAIKVERQWHLDLLSALERSGDLYELQKQVRLGNRKFKGLAAYEQKTEPWLKTLRDESAKKVLRAGSVYHNIATGAFEPKRRKLYLQHFIKKYPQTIYAKAAAQCLTSETKSRTCLNISSPQARRSERSDTRNRSAENE